MIIAQSMVLLAIFGAEVDRAGVDPWRDRLHAQITVESAWRPDVCSIYACGLAQFTPPTYGDIAPATRPSCASVPYTDPACSVRSQIVYMGRFHRTYRGSNSERDRWAFMQAAYNGGAGNLRKEKRNCKRRIGCDPDEWYGHVENVCLRADWACEENRAYPLKIERAVERLR